MPSEKSWSSCSGQLVTNQRSTVAFPASASWLFEFGEFVKLNGLLTPISILCVSGDSWIEWMFELGWASKFYSNFLSHILIEDRRGSRVNSVPDKYYLRTASLVGLSPIE